MHPRDNIASTGIDVSAAKSPIIVYAGDIDRDAARKMTFSGLLLSWSRLTSWRRRRQSPIFREEEREREVKSWRGPPKERRISSRATWEPRGSSRSSDRGWENAAIHEMMDHTLEHTIPQTAPKLKLHANLWPGLPVSSQFPIIFNYSSVADDRATTASTTRFQIVVCGRSTSPKRKLTLTATMRSHHTPRCVPLRTRSTGVQVVSSSGDLKDQVTL